ncbi:MAG: VapC toxin family PIN domain ribonuclease [Acidobacteria bacterium]|nr:MAG: VapC toxin family PIN domain ribonuclease [Acidobacteriota bacterium]
MKAVDTNILIRFLVGDDEKQARAVYQLFKATESQKGELFVPLLVVLELVWVLESVYLIERQELLDSISDLLMMPIFKFEHVNAIQKFAITAKGNTCDLSDLLIAHAASNSWCEAVYTFDKKASKCDLFELVK